MNKWAASGWVFSESRMSKAWLVLFSTLIKWFLESVWILNFIHYILCVPKKALRNITGDGIFYNIELANYKWDSKLKDVVKIKRMLFPLNYLKAGLSDLLGPLLASAISFLT